MTTINRPRDTEHAAPAVLVNEALATVSLSAFCVQGLEALNHDYSGVNEPRGGYWMRIGISNALFLQEARYSWAREPSSMAVLGLEPGYFRALHRPEA
ncbi:MAG: hypothetical protein ACREYF_24445, partial [Gammaproteobacteria bacterium]